jgi:predicted amidophosphoribosyltransferase
MCGMLDGMGKLSTNVGLRVDGIRKLVFPPVCLFCQSPLIARDGCCADCLEHIHVWPRTVCDTCGDVLPEDMAPGPCGRCLQKPPAQQKTHSLFEYNGPVREAILEWKLHGHEAGVRWLLAAAIPRISEHMAADDLLLPVPMPLSRMRKSGQHHAANMCRWLAEAVDCGWDWRVLRRVGEQPRQSSLAGSARRKNLRKAFAVCNDYAPRLQDVSTVWVVDDILTTGTTLHYAAWATRKLKKPVKALSLARTPHKR